MFIKTFAYKLMRVRESVLTFIYCIAINLKFNSPRLNYSPSWRFRGCPYIFASRGSRVIIGKNFIANSEITSNVMGVIQPVIIRAQDFNSEIIIGDNTGLSGCTLLAYKSIRIGDNVIIGTGVIISDTDVHPIHPEFRADASKVESNPVVIESDVFIGARAIILKGVTIGRGSVIGAGTVVVKNVPPYSIVVGNPAKVVGDVRTK